MSIKHPSPGDIEATWHTLYLCLTVARNRPGDGAVFIVLDKNTLRLTRCEVGPLQGATYRVHVPTDPGKV